MLACQMRAMKAALAAALILMSACSSQTEPQAPPEGAKQGSEPAMRETSGDLKNLIGLYEGPPGAQVNQLCVVEGKGGAERFGLVTWGGNLHSCSGTGTITRNGDTVRLAMTGDSACAIEAKISGTRIALPETVPEGCAYYCGARARLSGASFDQKGTTRADALRAKDLVGDPLCGDLSG
jgi:hypothetical protein